MVVSCHSCYDCFFVKLCVFCSLHIDCYLYVNIWLSHLTWTQSEATNFVARWIFQRKLEKEFALYGGAPPSTASGPDESDENNEEDEGSEPTASVSGIILILWADGFTSYYNASLRTMDFTCPCIFHIAMWPFYDSSLNLLLHLNIWLIDWYMFPLPRK